MITFTELRFKNFLSYGDKFTTIRLDKHDKTLIIGENGHGKSTMLDAISFVLFGKPYRKVTKSQLVNSINQKNLLVEIDFTIGKFKYSVRRGIGPNVFEIYKDGVKYDQSARVSDHQKILEDQIIKLNHKSFHQICVLGSANFIPFMQLSAAQRREIIEDLLDIGVFSSMNLLAKGKIKELGTKIKACETDISNVNVQIRLKTQHIADIKTIIEDNSKKLDEDKLKVENEIKTLESQKSKLYDTLGDLKSLKSRITSNDNKISKLKTIGTKVELNIKNINKDTTFFKQNSECPTCNQTIVQSHIDSVLSRNTIKLDKLTSGYKELVSKVKELTKIDNTLASEYEANLSIQQSVRTIDSNIKLKRDQLTDITNKMLDRNEDISIDGSVDELTLLYSEKDKFQRQKDTEHEDLTYMSAVQEMLKDSGIKTQVIRQYIPIINKFINDYLGILDFFVLFTLDESFNETIRSRHRDIFSYSSFSEGEKSRIDLALLFTWREIARLKNSANTNLLILDETLDQSLDVSGIDKLMGIINTTSKRSNVFVISHREVNRDQFDDVMVAKKSQMFSFLESIRK